MASTQTLPDRFSVITTITEHTIRTMTRASSLSLQGWDGVNYCECLLRVITIGSSELDCQRNAPTITDQMTLAA